MISSFNYKGDGSISYQTRSKYDDKGNKVETISEFTEEIMQKSNSIQTYKYDDFGNNIEATYQRNDGTPQSVYTYKYDEKGNKIQEDQYY